MEKRTIYQININDGYIAASISNVISTELKGHLQKSIDFYAVYFLIEDIEFEIQICRNKIYHAIVYVFEDGKEKTNFLISDPILENAIKKIATKVEEIFLSI